MKKPWKTSLFILFISVLAISLAACNIGTQNDINQLKKVRVAEVTRSIFYAPQYVAIEKGFFKEEGLDVEITTTWGGDKTMTALVSGWCRHRSCRFGNFDICICSRLNRSCY